MFELYDFSELRLFIENRLGIDTSRAKSNFIPIKKVFKTTRELDKSVEINPEGIFYTDEKGKRHKGFLFIAGGYKLDVAIARGWQTIVPKFHILNCSTIMQQKARANFNGHYVFSQKIEKVEDLDGIEKEVTLCRNCLKFQTVITDVITVSDYVKDFIMNESIEANFEDEDLPEGKLFDNIAYTADWDKKSQAYRIGIRFTCENCGIRLNENYGDGWFLETHHKDGNKINNDDSNLRALCTLCHSRVNEIHRNNYAKGKNKLKLQKFLEIFTEKLKLVNNPYL